MNNDAGQVEALAAHADIAGALEALAAEVARMRQEISQLSSTAEFTEAMRAAAFGAGVEEGCRPSAPGTHAMMRDAWIAEGRRREAAERAPHHARTRRAIPGYLRLVGGAG